MSNFFNTGTGLREDSHALLDSILEQGKYNDKSSYEKAKILLDSSMERWHGIMDYLSPTRSRVESNNFIDSLDNRGSIDLAKEYNISINDVPLLRTARNEIELKDIVANIQERTKLERESGLVAGGSPLWAGASMLANIATDPLLIPSIVLPELALSKLGTVARVAGGATIDAGLALGYDAIDFLATKKERDRGDIIGETLLFGLMGGAMQLIPRTFRTIQDVEDTKKVVAQSILPPFEQPLLLEEKLTKQGVIAYSDTLGQVVGLEKGWSLRKYNPLEARESIFRYIRENFTEQEVRDALNKIFNQHEETIKKAEEVIYRGRKDFNIDYKALPHIKKNKPKKSEPKKKKTRGETQAERVKRASIVGAGEREDEAKARVKALSDKRGNVDSQFKGMTKEELNYYNMDSFKNTYHKGEIEEAIKYLKGKDKQILKKALKGDYDVDYHKALGIMERLDNENSPHLKKAMNYHNTLMELQMFDNLTIEDEIELERLGNVLRRYYTENSPFILALGALGLGTLTEAEAGGGDNTYNPIDVILGLGLGILAIKYHKGIGDILRNAKRYVPKSTTDLMGNIGGTKSFFKSIDNLSDNFVSTKKIANIMLDNIGTIIHRSNKTVAGSASMEKEIMQTQILSKAFSKLTPLYNKFKEETSFKSLNPMKHVRHRDKFYKMIGEAYTTRRWDGLPSSVLEAKKVFDRAFEDWREAMIDAGVEGIKDMRLEKDYFPRYHNPRTYEYIHSLGLEEKDKVAKWYSQAIQRGFKAKYGQEVKEETALKMANKLFGMGKEDSYMKMLKEDVLFTRYEDFEKMEDYFNRAKFRIPMDFNIPPYTLPNGDKIRMSDFVETNAFSILERYSSMAGGHYAFGKMGIPNISNELKRAETEFAENGGDPKTWRKILDYANVILGRPISDMSDVALLNVFQVMRKATLAEYMHLSGIGALSEAIPAISRAMLNGNFGEAFRAFKKQSEEFLGDNINSLTEEISHELGIGYKRILAREGLANKRIVPDDVWTMGGQFTDKLDEILTPMKRLTFMINHLIPIDDLSNIMNIKTIHERLMKHLKTGKVYNARRLETMGLTDEKITFLKAEIDKWATDSRMNFNKWSDRARKIYREAMTSQKRAFVGDPTLGDIPLTLMKSPLMKTLATLLSYPIQSFDNALLRDIYARDSETIFRFMSMLVSTAFTIQLKNAVKNKYDDDERTLLQKTIEGLPYFALLDMGASLFTEKAPTVANLFPSLGVLENAIATPRSIIDISMGNAQSKDYQRVLQVLSVPMFLGKLIGDYAVPPPKTHQRALERFNATINGLK